MVTVFDAGVAKIGSYAHKSATSDKIFQKKPSWIKIRAPINSAAKVYSATKNILERNRVVTVCEEARCPNSAECWSDRHAAFMIMGDICTRACSFCNVKTGIPNRLDKSEPNNIALAVLELGLQHVVITSVDRDDLEDGGAAHFAKTISAVRAHSQHTTIEVLTPDFLRKKGALELVIGAKPDVFNHNLETVPSKYLKVRPGARYFHSIRLLQRAKELDSTIFTKSGIMLGLGETKHEVMQLMDDLRSADVDFLTLGQYLQPSSSHYPVAEFIRLEEFKNYELIAKSKGFLAVSATPFTRSSYHADRDFKILKTLRENQQSCMNNAAISEN